MRGKFLLVVLQFALGGFLVSAGTSLQPNILFCIADDWSWPHASAYGDKTVRTPTFDRLAKEGILFTHCFSAAPSCTPSRAAMLTGQYPHRLKEGGVLWGFLPRSFPTYTGLLAEAGYVVGSTRKGWGPGNLQAGGYSENPAGRSYRNFEVFLSSVPEDKPFCFWFGSQDPHRPYDPGSGAAAGLKAETVELPPFLPDSDVVINDVLDYYLEVQRFDREVGELLAVLDKAGKLENTVVVMTSDNGWPFPRCKANLYDGGTRLPLAIRWGAKTKPRQVSDDFVNMADMAPTFLELAGLTPLPEMTGRSLYPLLIGQAPSASRNVVYLERERHANVRAGDLGYPMRAIRTRDYLYIRNFHPDRWPAGDPHPHKDPARSFGDVDDGPAKNFILNRREEPGMQKIFELCFGKRPAEELYDLAKDPHQINNVATNPEYSQILRRMALGLNRWMRASADPRSSGEEPWDAYPYYGGQRPRR